MSLVQKEEPRRTVHQRQCGDFEEELGSLIIPSSVRRGLSPIPNNSFTLLYTRDCKYRSVPRCSQSLRNSVTFNRVVHREAQQCSNVHCDFLFGLAVLL